MAGKYVTTTRKQDAPQCGYLNAADRDTGNTAKAGFRPYVRANIGGTVFTNVVGLNTAIFPTQTTYSYRSIGSPLGPSQDELASILATPQRLSTYSPYDTGHEFNSSREFIMTSHPRYRKAFGNNMGGFEGPITWPTSGVVGDIDGLPALPAFDPAYTGRLLISQAAPTVPQANLLTTAAEVLREGIAIPGRNILDTLRGQSSILRGIGGEYLNAQFGWLPLVREFQNVLRAVVKNSEIISNFKENSGLVVRRRRGIPIKTSVEQGATNLRTYAYIGGVPLNTSTYASLWQTPPSGSGELVTITKQTSEEIWFSGAFTYYLAPDGDLVDKFKHYGQLANHLLGLRLTPEVIWELTPWSWLVDYFVDVGRALKLASLFSNDGLVLRYGYLMRKTSQSVTITGKLPPFVDGTSITLTTTRHRHVKSRVKATPYGFGLNPNQFTDRQWAILAALGLSRAPKSLP